MTGERGELRPYLLESLEAFSRQLAIDGRHLLFKNGRNQALVSLLGESRCLGAAGVMLVCASPSWRCAIQYTRAHR